MKGTNVHLILSKGRSDFLSLYITLALASSLSSCYGSSINQPDAAFDSAVEPLPDAGCAHRICDILPQCGCPEGYFCSSVEAFGRLCIPPGAGLEGSICSTSLDCSPGLVCQVSLCRRVCSLNRDCIDSSACYFHRAEGEVTLCNIECDMMTSDGCPSGFRCDYRTSDVLDGRFSDCVRQLGEGRLLDPCARENGSADCAAGYLCATDSVHEYCLPYCEGVGAIDPECPTDLPCCSSAITFSVDGITFGSCTSLEYEPCE